MNKVIKYEGYIVGVADTVNGKDTNADDVAYMLQHPPTPREGYDYRLKEDLTWEEYELPVIDTSNEEVDATEIAERIGEIL